MFSMLSLRKGFAGADPGVSAAQRKGTSVKVKGETCVTSRLSQRIFDSIKILFPRSKEKKRFSMKRLS